jgi:polygalacturonase
VQVLEYRGTHRLRLLLPGGTVSQDGVTRKEFLARSFAAGAVAVSGLTQVALGQSKQSPGAEQTPAAPHTVYDVRRFGATGDGRTLDTTAINHAIETAAKSGGGTVYFPAGTYLCYSIHLQSSVSLFLDAGATILAAEVPPEGTTTGGYDSAGPPQPWEQYQDFGHNHWRNSLMWGEDLHDVSILGPGLIWGKGLSRGEANEVPRAESPGVGNKAIALKNCHNVTFRDFSMRVCGHFAMLLTGVDNLLIDGLKIDTNRDGIDIDCCRNVHVSNCTVNSPWDDAICPKSSFALGYARPTENVTISNCYVTGIYDYGTLLDGTLKRMQYPFGYRSPAGRIKCGTESNGGFKNITISNCIFESCRGLALETVDGGLIEDVTISNVTMRGVVDSPLFLRLGARMRGPKGAVPGVIKRVLISNIVSSNAVAQYPSIISGIPGSMIEDIKISDVYLHQLGGGTKEWAALEPQEKENSYPEASMFGTLPARGFFVRHARNLEFSNVEVAAASPDVRPAFWMNDVDGVDLFRVKIGRTAAAYSLRNVRDFRSFGSRDVPDREEPSIARLDF